MIKQLTAGLAAIIIILSGCATTGSEGGIDRSQTMFLRGVFTWWEADPKFQLQRVEDQLYKSEAELKADGQPYSFKFADASWTAGNNCGFKNKAEGENVQLDTPVGANCSAAYDNFQFIPPETGIYEFFIDFTDAAKPMVTIKKKSG